MKKNKQKKMPLRTCVSCRETKEQKQLLRIVRNKDGNVQIDISGRMHGRGAYICRISDCALKAEKTRAFDRAFAAAVDKTIYREVRKHIENEEEK